MPARDYAQEHGEGLAGLVLTGIPRSLPGVETATAVRRLAGEAAARGRCGPTWRAYPRARHEILNETNRDEVQADLLDWLDKHV
ncbi:hypothetical protein GCM10009802_47530 [Streptomyces synnematoformans]|uniref:Serine aminopeptidase S33 domain-containing protein n=1 Tax=Streptomyces synnematoformans TaxID=415721 RepID=A0ABN2Z7Z6_9ACTN